MHAQAICIPPRQQETEDLRFDNTNIRHNYVAKNENVPCFAVLIATLWNK